MYYPQQPQKKGPQQFAEEKQKRVIPAARPDPYEQDEPPTQFMPKNPRPKSLFPDEDEASRIARARPVPGGAQKPFPAAPPLRKRQGFPVLQVTMVLLIVSMLLLLLLYSGVLGH